MGLLHPFSTPAQSLLMAASGLLVGSFSADKAGVPLIGFVLATLAGTVIWSLLEDLDPLLFSIACIISAVVALRPGTLRPLAIALAIAGGVLIGMASVPDPGPVRDRAFTLSGSIVGASIGLVYIAGLSILVRQRYQAQWVGIALRVLAAWVATIALLMLALSWQ